MIQCHRILRLSFYGLLETTFSISKIIDILVGEPCVVEKGYFIRLVFAGLVIVGQCIAKLLLLEEIIALFF